MKDRGRFQRKEGLFEGAWFWQDLLIVSSWVLLDKGCHALHCLRGLHACSPARCPLWVSKSEYRRAGKGGREGGSQGALGDWCPAKTVVQPCSLHPNNTFRHPSPPLPSPKNLDLTGFTGLLSKDSVPGLGELSVEGHLCLLPLPFPSSST